jgi:dihydrofolate reductase
VDWLRWNEEAAAVMAEYWKTFDTILMGRKTYEIALGHSRGKAPYPGMKTYVFSRTLANQTGSAVTIISSDACEFVERLKNQEGKDICVMGGDELAKSFF